MTLLTVDEVIALHAKLTKATGGSCELRDRGLLESAVYASEASFGDEEIYPTIVEKSARLAYALISNHAFVDGNKRIGIFVMLMTLRLNDAALAYTQQELIALGLDAASGKLTYEDILAWIRQHTVL